MEIKTFPLTSETASVIIDYGIRNMKDIDKVIIETEAEIKRLQNRLKTLRDAKNILDGDTNNESVDNMPISLPFNPGITVGDAVEILLKEIGKPLHADIIHSQLAAKGYKSSKNSVVSSINKDIKKRFTRTARNTFGLKEWK